MGFFYFIIYFNLFTFGYSFKEYLLFMTTNFKTYILLLGIILLLISLYRKEKKKWFILMIFSLTGLKIYI